MTPEDVVKTLVDQASALQREALRVAALFEQTNFLGDTSNMPHAHYGYLMAYLAKLIPCRRAAAMAAARIG